MRGTVGASHAVQSALAAAEGQRVGSSLVEAARAGLQPDGVALLPCAAPPEGMQCVEGGWFLRGVDEDTHRCDQSGQPRSGRPSTQPEQQVWVSTFYMDEREVTNAAYRMCVRAGGCPDSGPRYSDFSADEQPITGVSWFEARAFCAWRGARLPTEAEFEKASRGADGQLTPFGDTLLSCEQAVLRDARGRSCGVMKRGSRPEVGRVLPVGERPAGLYGLYDMVGNAEEWVADWWSPDWSACGDACRGVDPLGPCGGSDECAGHRWRVVRGGSWYWPAEHATGIHRRPHVPSNDPYHHFGFRCAASLTQSPLPADG